MTDQANQAGTDGAVILCLEPVPAPPMHVTSQALADLATELERARAKFPGNRFLLAALAEELGELADALLQMASDVFYRKHDGGIPVDVRKEAIQVACVALRIATEGDAIFLSRGIMQGSMGFTRLLSHVGGLARAFLQRKVTCRRAEDVAHTAQRISLEGDPMFASIEDQEALP